MRRRIVLAVVVGGLAVALWVVTMRKDAARPPDPNGDPNGGQIAGPDGSSPQPSGASPPGTRTANLDVLRKLPDRIRASMESSGRSGWSFEGASSFDTPSGLRQKVDRVISLDWKIGEDGLRLSLGLCLSEESAAERQRLALLGWSVPPSALETGDAVEEAAIYHSKKSGRATVSGVTGPVHYVVSGPRADAIWTARLVREIVSQEEGLLKPK